MHATEQRRIVVDALETKLVVAGRIQTLAVDKWKRVD